MVENIELLVAEADRAFEDNNLRSTTNNYLAKLFLPKRETFQKSSSIFKMSTDIYDTTGREAATIMANGLMGYLTPQTNKWFSLLCKDKSVSENHSVREYFREVEDVIYDVMGASNFYDEKHAGFRDFVVFGSEEFLTEEDSQDSVRYYNVPLQEIAFTEDDTKRVNGAYRFYGYTVVQALKKFGDKVRIVEGINKAIEAKNYNQKFYFYQIVKERNRYDPSKPLHALNMPYASYWVEKSERKLVNESGYHEFPYAVARYSRIDSLGEFGNSVQGYSPAHEVLPAAITLNKMMFSTLKGAENALDPAWIIPNNSLIMPYLRTGNGATNIAKAENSDKVRPLNNGARVDIGLELIQRPEQSIKRAFFVDMFLALMQSGQMTATEVRERINEKMPMLGPVLSVITKYTLSPTIYRTYAILARETEKNAKRGVVGPLPPVPQELFGKEFSVNYISILAKSQRMTEVNAIDNQFMFINSARALDPNILDRYKIEDMARERANITGVSPKFERSDEEVAQLRKARAEAQVQQQLMATLAQSAQTAKTAAEAGKVSAEAQNVQ